MKTIVLALIVCLLATVTYPAERFETTFRPAFHPSSTMAIMHDNDEATLTFRYGNLKTGVQQTEEFTLDQATAGNFFARFAGRGNHYCEGSGKCGIGTFYCWMRRENE